MFEYECAFCDAAATVVAAVAAIAAADDESKKEKWKEHANGREKYRLSGKCDIKVMQNYYNVQRYG